MYYINFDTNYEALEGGIIDSICPYPGPMDSMKMPINGEVFTGDTYQLISPQNMTSNFAPSPYVVYASSFDGLTYAPWKAFDPYDITRWVSLSGIINYEEYGVHSISIDLGASHEVSRVKIMPGNNGSHGPIYIKVFVLSSSDNINWELIYTSRVLSSTSWLALQDGGGYYTFDINDLYVNNSRYYKIYFSAVDNDGVNDVGRLYSIGVARLELYTAVGGTTTFTIPRIKKKMGRSRAYASSTYYNTDELFIKNEKILINNIDYVINDDQITFSTAPSTTDEIFVAQYPNGPMWFTEIPTNLYTVIPLGYGGDMHNIIPTMFSNTVPLPYAVSSSSEQTGNEAYNAFDKLININKGWRANSNTTLQYLEFDFSTNVQAATSFTILPYASTGAATIKVSSTMSSDLSPAPHATTASSFQISHEPYKAFDGLLSTSNGWLSNSGTTHWIQYDIGTAQKVNSFVIFPYVSEAGVAGLSRFSLQGSNDGINWIPIGTEQINVTGWVANTPKFFSFYNEIAYRYYRLNIINSTVSTAGITELELYYSTSNLLVSDLDTFSFQASNDRINWFSLYVATGQSGNWEFGAANTYTFSNSNFYRYYRLYIWPNGGQNIAIGELEIRSIFNSQVKNRITLNASLSQIEPGNKKLRIKYYDYKGTLKTEYFNVPFWDNYKIDADDLNDMSDYYYSILSDSIDDTGLYTITRDSNYTLPNGIISRIARTYYTFDNSLHSELLVITRNSTKNITSISQYVDNVLIQTATISRDFNNFVNMINLEEGT